MNATTQDVLEVLLEAWKHGTELPGWQIIKLARRSGSAVFGALDRLEDAGWITGEWETLPPGEDRPRRRYYRLTPNGVAAARRRLADRPRSKGSGVRPVPGLGVVDMRPGQP